MTILVWVVTPYVGTLVRECANCNVDPVLFLASTKRLYGALN